MQLRMVPVACLCAALVAGACGNVTTRQERLAARGIRAEAPLPAGTAPSAASGAGGAPAPDDGTGTALAADPATAVGGTSAGPGGATAPRTASGATATGTSAAGGRGTAGGGAPAPVGAAGASGQASSPAQGGGTGPAPAQPAQPGTGQAATPQVPAGKSEIVMGSFGVEAGPLGTISGPAAPAIRAWVADVNHRGGLNGHPVRVILADDGGDPARAQAVVRQMVEKDKVVAFFYPYAIGTLVPVLPYLEEKGIPVLGQMGAETLADYSQVVFQPFLGADKGTSWAFIMAITEQSDKKKLGIFYCREVQACTLQKDGVKKLLPYKGLEAVYEAQISLAQPDYTAETLGAQRAGADVILIFSDVATVARIAQSAHRQGYHPQLSATHNLQHRDSFAYQEDLDGLVFYSRIPPYDSPKMADYRRALNTYQPKAPIGELGGSAYVMGKLLEVKVAPLLDDDPSPAEITEAMYTLENETLDGLLPPITFPKAKDRSTINLCVIAIAFKGGKFVPHDPQSSFVCAPGWKPGG